MNNLMYLQNTNGDTNISADSQSRPHDVIVISGLDNCTTMCHRTPFRWPNVSWQSLPATNQSHKAGPRTYVIIRTVARLGIINTNGKIFVKKRDGRDVIEKLQVSIVSL